MKEQDIRPQALLDEYLRLSAEDGRRYFTGSRAEIPCVACGGRSRPTFEKHGFRFRVCDTCDTLYQSPRPAAGEFHAYYADSPSARYWSSVFFPAVKEQRRTLIFSPRVDAVRARVGNAATVLEVGAGHGMFLTEWASRFPDSVLRAVEPSADSAKVLREEGIDVVEDMVEDVDVWYGDADLVASFELIEHVRDPSAFVAAIARLVRPGGTLLVTGLSGDGFDIRTLWERSKAVSPPHHINFISAGGFRVLFEAAGLTDVEVVTPGRLDVDIVRNTLQDGGENGEGADARFARVLLKRPAAASAFQSFLADHGLSSHAWIWARRPE